MTHKIMLAIRMSANSGISVAFRRRFSRVVFHLGLEPTLALAQSLLQRSAIFGSHAKSIAQADLFAPASTQRDDRFFQADPVFRPLDILLDGARQGLLGW